MVEDAERIISELRKSLADLETEVNKLSFSDDVDDPEQVAKFRAVSELITQALLKADSIQISKDLAADAFRNGDRDKSRKVAVLLARRKTVIKRLNDLAEKADQHAKKLTTGTEKAEQ